jgi:bacterioferritin-associated ferredoxin
MYVCICEAVTEDDVRAEIRCGARSLGDVADRTGAGTNCGTCHDRLQELLDAARSSAA